MTNDTDRFEETLEQITQDDADAFEEAVEEYGDTVRCWHCDSPYRIWRVERDLCPECRFYRAVGTLNTPSLDTDTDR